MAQASSAFPSQDSASRERDPSLPRHLPPEADALQLTFQRATQLAARLLSAPLALVRFQRDGRSQVMGATGFSNTCPASLLELVEELCDGVRGQTPFVLAGAPSHAAAQALGIAACACVPIRSSNGELFAHLCVLDRETRSWAENDLQALESLCVSVIAEIELHGDRLSAAEVLRQFELREQEVRAGELRFALAFRAHPLPMTVHDYPEGRYLDVNEAWLAQTGFAREEAIGKTSTELNLYVDPSVRAKLFRLLSDQGYARGLEADMRMKNGEVRHFLLTSQRVVIGGQSRLLSGIHDITEPKRIEAELRKSEEQLRLITDALPVYILHCDTQFRYKFVNTAYAARFGLTPEALLGKRIADVVGEEAWRTVEEQLNRVLSGEFVQYELRIPYRDIGARFMRSVNVPERDARGTVRGLIGVLIDISEQKQIEEERAQLLQQSLEQSAQLRAADRRKDEFLAMLSHELRNPLAPMNNAAQLLPRLVRDEPQARQAVEIVQRQVKHMTRLVEDLLDVSRITLGKVTLRKKEADVAQILRAGIELTRPLIDEKRHEMTITLPVEPLVVVGDPARLAQVVGNLLNNAAKYTEEGGTIALSAERQAEQVVIKVKDNGIGIAAELLPHVFDLFTQAERTLDRSQGGLGIGLALVKSLVTMHGGSVEANSDGPGAGSELVVRLPLLMQFATARAGHEVEGPTTVARRILVVDDNVDAADSLAMLLRFEGHEVSVAYHVTAALELARQHRPNIFLLDIGLPGTDGYALARQLRELTELRGARLIAITGYGLTEDRERGKAAGFDHHLVKPVDPEVLRALLSEA